jgi:hypothetical protein
MVVDVGNDGPSYFVLSMVKSGSTMLNEMVTALSLANGHHFIDVSRVFLPANVSAPTYSKDPALSQMLHPGNVYGGFRRIPQGLTFSPQFINGAKVLLVRDPRDVLVSLYFSDAFSHEIPAPAGTHDDVHRLMTARRQRAREIDIDSFVLEEARGLFLSYQNYVPLLGFESTALIRYEDIIFDKASLIDTVVRHFGWQCDDELSRDILKAVDVRPADEQPERFIRQVSPGDHRAKLQSSTVDSLSRWFSPIMEAFGYAI